MSAVWLNDPVPAPPLSVDPLLSYARRDGDAIRVVLSLPTATFKRREVWLRLQGDEGGVLTDAQVTEEDGRLRVVGSVPRIELPDGVYRLKLRIRPEGPLRNLRTRLLVSDAQPVALLPKFEADAVVS